MEALTKSDKTIQLDEIGKETLLALLSFKNKSRAAKALSIERSTLYQRIDKYKLAEYLARIPEHALQTLQMGSEHAAEVMVDALDENKNKMEAAIQILDRAGVTSKQTPTTNVQINNIIGEKKEIYGI